MTIAVVSQFKQLRIGQRNLHFTCISVVHNSFYSVSILGLMNSINWPASSVWVFIAQLVEHCSANAEAKGSNPVEDPKIFLFGLIRSCLNCDTTAMITHSFH